MEPEHSTLEDDREDYDSLAYRRARALLIYAFASKCSNTADVRAELIDRAARANRTNAFAVHTEVAKLVDECGYFKLSGASTRWSLANGGFYDVFDGAYAMRVLPIDATTKAKVRGKYKCSICGQREQNCGFAVHLAGTPPVDTGTGLPKYSAKEFQTANIDLLENAYARHVRSALTAIRASDAAVSSYLGVVLPGKTCMKRILAAFSAQDFVRSVFDLAHMTEIVRFPDDQLSHKMVKKVADRFEQLSATAAGNSKPAYSNEPNDCFWTDLFERFAKATSTQMASDAFLDECYKRMNQNIDKTVCVPCDEEEVVVRHRRKRTCVVSDEEDDVEDEEDDVEDEDENSMADFIVEDSDDEADAPQERPQRWGATEASRAGPFAPRRRPVHEPFAPPEAQAARRRHEEPPQPSIDHPVLNALSTVDKTTARKLRAPPTHAIGSRRSTILKLSNLVVKTLKDGNLNNAKALSHTAAILMGALAVAEMGCTNSLTKLEETTNLLGPTKTHFLHAGEVESAVVVAEAIILAHELLS